MYNCQGGICYYFHEIQNSQKFAFLVDYDTLNKSEEEIITFIKGFETNKSSIKIKSLFDYLPSKQI